MHTTTSRRVGLTIAAVEKTVSSAYSERLFVALDNQHEMHIRHIPTCNLPDSTIFFHIISWTAPFSKKKKPKLLNIKCVLIFSTTFVWNISHSKNNWARHYIGILVQYRLILSDFN
jgi:hypothetical protein